MPYKKPTTLLAANSSAKAAKGSAYKALNAILYLTPSLDACPNSGLAGCAAGCLYTAGRGAMSPVQQARINRTKYYKENPAGFMAQLNEDIARLQKQANKNNLDLVVRLNGTSDFDWLPVYNDNPQVQFIEYTKVIRPHLLQVKNLHLTFSYSGKPGFFPIVQQAKNLGYNIAAVFRDSLPASFLGLPVINGDLHDLRHLDKKEKRQVIVGLLAKGKAKNDYSGFVVDSNIIPTGEA